MALAATASLAADDILPPEPTAAEKEAVDLVKKALANGTTVDDILELLK